MTQFNSADRTLLCDLVSEYEAARAAGGHALPEEFYVTCHPELRGRESLLAEFKSLVAKVLHAAALGLGGEDVKPRDLPPPDLSDSVSQFSGASYLNHGGLGIVYTAVDELLERDVAVKILRPGSVGRGDVEERLGREARITAQLDHPGVVPVYGQGVDKHTKGPYYAMGLVRGERFEDLVRQHYRTFPTGGKESRKQALAFRKLLGHFASVCNTIAHSHSKNIVHRDLKPRNVMVGDYGRVIVIDWGLAKKLSGDVVSGVVEDSSQGQASAYAIGTKSDDVLGTPAFASPEQFVGGISKADKLSDVYSLGATLYFILTDDAPFSPGEDQKKQVLTGNCVPPRTRNRRIDPALEKVCQKAMAVLRKERYQTVEALGEDIERWLADAPLSVYKEPYWRRVSRWRRRHPFYSGAIASAGVLLVVVLVVWVFDMKESWRRVRIDQQVEACLRQSETKTTEGDDSAARAVLGEAIALLAMESGFDSLRERVVWAADRAEVRARVASFSSVADRAESEILGGYWTLLPHEESGDRRRITNPGERVADLSKGAALARQALESLNFADGRFPFAKMVAGNIGPTEIERVRRRAAEVTFLVGIAEERLGQAEPEGAQGDWRHKALGRLDEAEALGMHDRVIELFRADILERDGAIAEAKALRDRAESRRPESFLDHHFAAAKHARAGRWAKAVISYQVACALRPNEYWTLFRMGKALEKDNQASRAEPVYRALLTIASDDPTVQNSLGSLLMDQHQWKLATIELEAVVRSHPDYLMAYSNLMWAYAELADVPRTTEVHGRLLKRLPDPRTAADAWTHMGLAHERAKNDKAAVECFTRAIETDPKSKHPLRNRAAAMIRANNFDAAEVDINNAIRLAPTDGQLHYVKGNVFAKSKRRRPAIAEYTEALRLDPKLSDAHKNRAIILYDLGQYENAIKDHEAVLRAEPNHPTARFDIAICHVRIGKRDHDDAQLRVALSVVAEVLDKDPKNSEALRLRGKLHGDLGRYQDGIGPDSDLVQSEADLTEVIRLTPTEADAYLSRGNTRLKAQAWLGALEDWTQYRVMRPDAPNLADMANNMSTAYLELGDVDKATEALAWAQSDKKQASYSTNLGNVYLKTGDLSRAIAEFDQAIEVEPDHARAWALRAQARLRQGQFAAAVADLDQALKLEPGFYETLALGGTAKLLAGDAAGARRLLEQIVKERPEHPRGHYALGQLRLLEGKGSEAVQELTRAMGDPVLREFALGPRAEAWLSLGGGGLEAAIADAESLRIARPKDGLAQLGAARIYARAAGQVTAERGAPWRTRAVELLEQAVTLQPDLRPCAVADDVLRPLTNAPGSVKSGIGR